MNDDNKKLKYILYKRKSTDDKEKQVLSLHSQEEEMLKIAKRDKLEIVYTLEESRSAKLPKNRPLFAKMLTDISAGKANAILCWRMDRLSRNPVDSGELSWMLQQGVLQHIKTHEREYYPKDNVIVMSVDTAMANQYIRDLSEGVTTGLKQKAQMGWFPSRAPIGYINDKSEVQGQRKIHKDPKLFDLVRKIFDYMLTGAYTPLHLWRIFNEELNAKVGTKHGIAPSYIYRILTNTFYYGMYEYPRMSGNWYQGKHDKMITPEEYDQIQVLLGRKSSPKPKGKFFQFTTLIRCNECKARITAEHRSKKQKNGNVHEYTYYHCTKRIVADCKQKYIEEAEMIKQIGQTIEKLSIPPEFHEWAMIELKIAYEKEVGDRNLVHNSLEYDYNKTVGLIDSYIEMRANKELTVDEFTIKKSIANQEKLRLSELLENTDKVMNDWATKTEKDFNFTLDAIERFKNGSPYIRREMVAYLGLNHTLFNQILALDIEKPLLYIEDAVKEVKQINKRFVPVTNGVDKERLHLAYSQNPLLCSR